MSNKWIERVLNRVERAGNKLPDPTSMFIILCFSVLAISWLLSHLGVSAVHPADQKVIAVENLLSSSNIQRIFTDMVKNFAAFPPLGTVLVTIIGIGVAEKSGLITAALKAMVTAVPKSLLTPSLVFAGVMSSMASDAGYVVLTPLGALLFAGFGKHPLAGLAASFAGVAGGYSANLFLTSLDPMLAGLSTTSAQLIDSSYVVQASANYYFMIMSTFLITIVGTIVTTKIVEPRLGVWVPPSNYSADNSLSELSSSEKRGLWISLIASSVFAVILLLMTLPEGAIFRNETGFKPLYDSLVSLIMIGFLVAGLAYGISVKTIKSDKDAVSMMSEYMSTMGAYIVLAFFAAQFIAYFSWSNLGFVIAIKGADFLKDVGLTGMPLIIGFIIVTGLINLFIGSASAKWAIMGPVFIPMLMLTGYSPELVQVSYRVGDSISNIISPLLPYFPIIIAFAKRYDPRAGIGTLISSMLPYSVAFGIVWTIVLLIWVALGIPLGPDAPLFYNVK